MAPTPVTQGQLEVWSQSSGSRQHGTTYLAGKAGLKMSASGPRQPLSEPTPLSPEAKRIVEPWRPSLRYLFTG